MNKRQKITISIVGITIVLLALLGLTYAYFLTRITGNTNDKSISVSTANLALVYGDGNGVLEVGEVLSPGDTVKFKTAGGVTVDKKTFSVTNQGNAKTDYVVVIEDVNVTYAETIEVDGETHTAGTSTTFASNDFVYTLTCTSGCNGVDKDTTFPINGGILVGNSIDVGEEQTYELRMTYLETGIDQSADMNKSLTARVNIKDISTINPYSGDTNSLAYNIINNAVIGATGTTLASAPLSPVATSISDYGTGKYSYETVSTSSLCSGTAPWLIGDTATAAQSGSSVSSYDAAVGKYVYDQCSGWTKYLESYDSTASTLTFKSEEMVTEKTLSVAQDDLGTSYYYRGNVEDNYVTFADMCWRIVRINGDGSTKLILEDQDQPCSTSINGNWGIPTTTGGSTYTGNFGYTQYNKNTLTASDGTQNSGTKYIMDYLHGQTNSASSMATAFKNFQSTFTETELSKLKSGNWCLGDAGYSRTGSSNSDYTYTLLNETQMMDNKIKGTSFYYDSYVRLRGENKDGFQPTLKCNGTIMNDWDDNETNPTPMYVGGITADEMVYAGGKVYTSNQNFYLMNDSFKNGELDYYYFWSLSPNYFNGTDDSAFDLSRDGRVGYSLVDRSDAFRPAVSLASSAVISSGEGTLESPYVIG